MLFNVLFFKWHSSQLDIYFQEMDPIPGDTQKLGKLKELTQESNSFPWRCELALAGWGSLVTHGIPRFSHQKVVASSIIPRIVAA